MVSLGLAVLAAACNALSSVLQRKANIAEAKRRRFGLSLLLHLLVQPAWLAGVSAMIASFVLQATALSLGTLSAVEPVLVLELPLSLILGAVLIENRLHTRDWVASAAMALGLALLIAVLSPHGGDAQDVSTATLLLTLAATIAGVVVMVLAGRFGPRRSRAALFGSAAGSGFGITAGLLKFAMAELSAGGAVGLFSAWQTYGAVVFGIGSLVLVQAALNAGTLVAAQPGITLLDPLVSVLWGAVVVGERTRTGPVLLLAVFGGTVVVTAVVWLAEAAARTEAGTGR